MGAKLSWTAGVMRAAARRDDGSYERMQAAAQKNRAEKRAREQTELEATEQRRKFQEFLRSRAANEDILAFNPEDADLVPESSAGELHQPATPTIEPDRLDSMYEQFRSSATGPVLVKQPREKPRTPAQQQADFLAAQLAANELHLNPATGELEPLSPPPSVDD